MGSAGVGLTPFSQPWAALQAQMGIQPQLQAAAQLSSCKCFPGASSLQAEGQSPQVQADTCCVLCGGSGCPRWQDKCKGESQALPFGRMVLFAITNSVMQKEESFSRQNWHIIRVLKLWKILILCPDSEVSFILILVSKITFSSGRRETNPAIFFFLVQPKPVKALAYPFLYQDSSSLD